MTKAKTHSGKAHSKKSKKSLDRTEPEATVASKVDILSSESEHENDDSDDEGVDEEGMSRLIKALGEDGLDDFDRAQLSLMLGNENQSEGEDDNGEETDASDGGEGVSDDDENGSEKDGGSEDEENEEHENEDEEEDDSENEQEEDVLLEDVEEIEEDTVPRQRVEIDNTVALERIRESIQLDPSFPWTETLVLSYPHSIDVDVDDDLKRELAFYKQALHGADAARVLAAKHKLPFKRPDDFFAEMVKTDSHMERIRQRLLDESATIKKSEAKRKEREGKKFGKQVQIEKLKERERSKKDMEERLKGLKRKRKDVLDNPQGGDDDFDIAVEDAVSDRPTKRARGGGAGGSRVSRQARNSKYGFGGAKRRSKQNTKASTDNFVRSGRGGRGGSRGGRGGARGGAGGRRESNKRPGKSRRMASRSKA